MNTRYERNLLCSSFTNESQDLLQNAKVLVVGAGGLGSYVLQHLTVAGVGTIGIAEFDCISMSNLNRQILYTTDQIDTPKIDCAYERLIALNPTITIIKHSVKITEQNIVMIAKNYDMMVDCTDNFEIRYIMDSECERRKIPLVHGSVANLSGSATTFLYKNGKNYRTLYGDQKRQPTKAAVGVLSPIVGVVGSIQASEVIKLITGIAPSLSNKLLTIDLALNNFTTFDL